MNETTQKSTLEIKTPELQPTNIIETFSKRLYDLVYSAAEVDTAKYRQQGLDNSRESQGNLNISIAEHEHIKEIIKTYLTDEGLGSKKNVLASNISFANESTKTSLEIENQEKISVEKRNNDLEKKQITDIISEITLEKSIIESGNQNTGEKGLLQINIEIEKNTIERRALEQTFIIKKFWDVGTILSLIGLLVFTYFLSIFFASVVYKVFFEENEIRTLLQANGNAKIPQIVDANAIIKIFSTQGVLFGVFLALFFLIPLLLTNLKLFGRENKSLSTQERYKLNFRNYFYAQFISLFEFCGSHIGSSNNKIGFSRDGTSYFTAVDFDGFFQIISGELLENT